jgi:hypothetical protein
MGLEDDAPQGAVEKWIYGALGPLMAAWYSGVVIARGSVWIPSRTGGSVEFHGTDATAWGVLFLAMAATAHCHFLWGNTERLAPFSDLGKCASLIVLVLTVAYLFYRVLG